MGYDTHSTSSTPAANFVNVAANDYHLIAGAPAVDHGEASHAPPYDLEGHVRPFGSATDIGAYEFGSTMASDAGTFVDAGSTPDAGQRHRTRTHAGDSGDGLPIRPLAPTRATHANATGGRSGRFGGSRCPGSEPTTQREAAVVTCPARAIARHHALSRSAATRARRVPGGDTTRRTADHTCSDRTNPAT